MVLGAECCVLGARLLPHSALSTQNSALVSPDGPDVFQRDGHSVAGRRSRRWIINQVPAVLDGHAVAGGGSADEVALLQELPVLCVEVELHIGADLVPKQG